MKLILRKDIEKLGKFGETVNVSNGYARNYLLPRDLAWPFEDKYVNMIGDLRNKMESEKAKAREHAGETAKKIEDISITVEVEVGEEDKLFGSVTNIDIREKLEENGIKVDKKDIQIEEPIKKLGVYKVTVNLHPEVKATCKLWVVKK
ncbi:MAG: 50S ribosomal protein L9 [Elusimicrobia bacterium]|nr:50S ribosomal protein L9 [Elusimicrobiota bacterium]